MKAATRLGLVMAVLLGAGVVCAEEPVGWVAAIEGRAEAMHPGAAEWVELAGGGGILLGDQVRTPADSKVKLLFRDDSVLTLAANSQITVTEQVAGAAPVSHFSLLVGVVRAIVTERYGAPGARFEVETPTAIAGVRGTGFIARYDTAAEETLVLGLFDVTRVRAVGDRDVRREIPLGPGQHTTVRRGSYPLPAKLMPEADVRNLSAATSLKAGAGGPQAGQPGAAEPRLPGRAGQHATPPSEQAVDQPVPPKTQGPQKPPPPPPPPPR